MASNTPNLNLLKKDPIVDRNDTFNIQTMLNDNWDKIDAAMGDIDIPEASLDVKGKVQLSNALNSDAEDLAATPKAVKAAYDAGAAAQATANQAFQAGNERKQEVVDALIALGVTASMADSWDVLISKMSTVIKATGNATAADVLAGKTASNKNGLITGTIPKLAPVHGDQANATNISIGAYSNDGQEYVYLGVPSGSYLDGVNWIRQPKFSIIDSVIPRLGQIGAKVMELPISYSSSSLYGRDINQGVMLFWESSSKAALCRINSVGNAQILVNFGSGDYNGLSFFRWLFHVDYTDAANPQYYNVNDTTIRVVNLVKNVNDNWETSLIKTLNLNRVSSTAFEIAVQCYNNEIIVPVIDANTLYIDRYNKITGVLLGSVATSLVIPASPARTIQIMSLPEGKTLVKQHSSHYRIARYTSVDHLGNIIDDFNRSQGNAEPFDLLPYLFGANNIWFRTYNGSRKLICHYNDNFYNAGIYEQAYI